MKKLLLLFVVTMNLTACSLKVENNDAEQPNPLSPPIAPEALPKSDQLCTDLALAKCPVAIQVSGSEKPNIYKIALSWQPREGELQVKRGSETLGSSAADKGQLVIDNLTGGQQLNLQIEQWIPGRGAVDSIHLGVTLPEDWVIGQNVFLERDHKFNYGRVFFLQGAKLFTQGYQIDVTANEIISEKGSVISFPSNQQALPTQAGRSGGLQSWKFLAGKGELKFEQRGEAGGPGRDGQVYTLRAVNGANGTDGAHEYRSRCIDYVQISSFQDLRCPLSTDSSGYETLYEPLGYVCTRQPTSGHPGADGMAGRPGTSGGRGGDSGQIFFAIQDGSAVKIQYQIAAGHGGQEGKGGPGQLGGLGGQAGHNPGSCSNASAGATGKTGPQGPPGLAGQAGAIGQFCLNTATSTQCGQQR